MLNPKAQAEVRLLLKREYDPECTDGVLFNDQGSKICYTLELPQKDNKKGESCIPEGTYNFHKMFSQHLGWVYRLDNVPDRSLIDIHAGNTVLDIRGCILVGEKQGVLNVKGKHYPAVLDSKKALAKLFSLVGNDGIITIMEGS